MRSLRRALGPCLALVISGISKIASAHTVTVAAEVTGRPPCYDVNFVGTAEFSVTSFRERNSLGEGRATGRAHDLPRP